MWDQETGEVLDESPGGAERSVALGVLPAPADDGGLLALMVRSAQSLVRDRGKLIAAAKQIGGLLAGAAFYRFPAGGSTVSGPSIDLAEALAQEWGAIVYQVRIVHAEPMASGGQRVHLRASVADMRTLVCAEVDQVVSTSPPPGKFAEKAEQRERWHGMQLQSAASKIVRNAILRVLPEWYVGPAFDAAVAMDSKRALDGKTLPEARKAASDALLAQFGCSVADLEAFLAQPFDMWAVPQIAQLRDLFAELKSGRQSIEAWRAALDEKRNGGSTAPTRTALGLPARSSAADPLELKEPKTAEPAERKGKG
jgi:hypothetical protein